MQTFPVQSITRAVNKQVCQSLCQYGYAVVDNVFGKEWASGFRSEIELLRDNQIMFTNATHVHLPGSNQPLFIDKKNILEMELVPDIYDIVPDFLRPLDEDKTIINLLNHFLAQKHIHLENQAIKLQFNSGDGGCFPLHFDSDPKLDPRKISAVLYLNPEWKTGDGGELKLYPFPYKPVTIEPIMDRLVLFSSSNTLHSVVPSKAKERFCLTLWYSGTQQQNLIMLNKPENESNEAVLKFLLQPHLRRHLAKVLYADEWANSIIESHHASNERNILLENHWKDVQVIKKVLARYMPFVESTFPIDLGSSSQNLSQDEQQVLSMIDWV